MVDVNDVRHKKEEASPTVEMTHTNWRTYLPHAPAVILFLNYATNDKAQRPHETNEAINNIELCGGGLRCPAKQQHSDYMIEKRTHNDAECRNLCIHVHVDLQEC